MEKWIVTAGSTNFYDNLMTSFIASLRETAGWEGNIGIINYGFTPHEVWTLRLHGIQIIPPVMKYAALIDDRFTTIGNFFKDKNAQIGAWDSDIWFCQPVDDIFDKIRPGALCATYDATVQGFMDSCINPNSREIVGKHIDEIRKDIGHVLQGGFIGGDSQSWYMFSGYQDTMIDLEIGYDAFGIDMVALNLFYKFFPDKVDVLGVEWNCLPEWTIKQKEDGFYCRESEESLRAIHVSSPNRVKPYLYQTHFPEEFEKWSQLLKR